MHGVEGYRSEAELETYQRQYDILLQLLQIHKSSCSLVKQDKACSDCSGYVEDLNYLYGKILSIIDFEEKEQEITQRGLV